MPFNAGGQTYQGGSFLYGGLSNFGKGISEGVTDAFTKLEESRKMEQYNDLIVQNALKNGEVTLEDFAKYKDMSRTQKTGYAAGIAANFMENFKREQLQSLKEQREASAELRRQQAAALSWKPTEGAREQARWTGNELIEVGPGKFQLSPYGEDGTTPGGEPVIKPFIDPNTKKPVPGVAIVHGPGKQFQIKDFATGDGLPVQIDPVTGSPFYYDRKGDKHFMKAQDVLAGKLVDKPATPEAGTATPAEPGSYDTLSAQAMMGNIPGALGEAWRIITRGTKPVAAKATGNEVIAPTPAPTATPQPGPGAQAKTAATGKVKMMKPDGTIGYVPADWVDKAISAGYKRVE